jgi:hypothetical protein
VRSRAAKEKMHMAKAQLNSVAMNIQMQICEWRVGSHVSFLFIVGRALDAVLRRRT